VREDSRYGAIAARTFDWGVMDKLGECARLEGLLSERWRDALAAPAQQYVELTVEFISTLQHTSGDFSAPTIVSFSLGRRIYDMSILQFAVATGLYTEEDVVDPQFETRIRGLFRRSYEQGVTDLQLAAFWGEIAGTAFTRSAVESSIRDPVL
jgi:hypothetical protein